MYYSSTNGFIYAHSESYSFPLVIKRGLLENTSSSVMFIDSSSSKTPFMVDSPICFHDFPMIFPCVSHV